MAKYVVSDYFDALYDFAVELINKGLADVGHLTSEQMREYRGTLTQPGKPSPNRDRLLLRIWIVARMKAGESADVPWCRAPKSIWLRRI